MLLEAAFNFNPLLRKSQMEKLKMMDRRGSKMHWREEGYVIATIIRHHTFTHVILSLSLPLSIYISLSLGHVDGNGFQTINHLDRFNETDQGIVYFFICHWFCVFFVSLNHRIFYCIEHSSDVDIMDCVHISNQAAFLYDNWKFP